jgi:hypothetical protein
MAWRGRSCGHSRMPPEAWVIASRGWTPARYSHTRGLYESEGYAAIGNFNGNPVATFFGEKRLAG